MGGRKVVIEDLSAWRLASRSSGLCASFAHGCGSSLTDAIPSVHPTPHCLSFPHPILLYPRPSNCLASPRPLTSFAPSWPPTSVLARPAFEPSTGSFRLLMPLSLFRITHLSRFA